MTATSENSEFLSESYTGSEWPVMGPNIVRGGTHVLKSLGELLNHGTGSGPGFVCVEG